MRTWVPLRKSASKYMAECMDEVMRVANLGRNMAFFYAPEFKSKGGIEYFRARGFGVYLVEGGMYDHDDYRVEW